jgi:hypothetical protein
MISLQPIHKKIRETLHNKSRAVSRDFTGTELDPVDVIRETYAKTTWVKMFSPVDNTKDGGLNTVSIVNGVLDKSGDMFSGFDSLYRQGGGPLAPTTGTDGEVKSHRPIPGIKDVTIDYKDGLAAIRTATINWTCWTFQDLEVLQAHFMSTGVGVLLEWGWSVPSVKEALLFTEADMIDGKAYTLIQDKVIANAGNYDAMAGIISNWEWTLRDDGGFDCTTTLTSRGVNILQGDSAAPGTKVEDEDGKLQPPLKIFVGGLKETLYDLTTEGSWWKADKHKPLSPAKTEVYDPKNQPPGVLSWIVDNKLPFTDIAGGPWVSWGFLEDNILSRFAGLVRDSDNKPISSFRSIEPVLVGDDGQYEGMDPPENSGTKVGVDNPFQAKFQSVIIRNSEWLLTPSFNRWILPGQFPAGNIAASWSDFIADYGDFVMSVCKGAFSDGGVVGEKFFPNFAVDSNDKSKGGYLRNILISYDLIEEAFSDATNIREGMSNLFDEFNTDLDGYWNFKLISDVHNPGNIKVVDSNKTLLTVSDLIKDRETKSNPDSKLFMFPSWGEKSIVKSQTLNQKIPNAMAISAMYAQTAKKEDKDAASPEGQGIAAMSSSPTAVDVSQGVIRFAKRVGKTNAYGSISPYGDLDGVKFSSDLTKATFIPNGATFGHNHGIAFDLDTTQLLMYYMAAAKEQNKTAKEDLKEKRKKQKEKDKAEELAKVVATEKKVVKKNFEEMMKQKQTPIELPLDSWWPHDWGDQTTFTLYDRDGHLTESFEYNVLPRIMMIEYIHGTTIPLDESKADTVKKIDMPIPIELEITIDGTGGIIPGNPFQVDYIPQRYNTFTVFQSLSVGHTIDSSNWTTTIKGQIRVAMDKIKD